MGKLAVILTCGATVALAVVACFSYQTAESALQTTKDVALESSVMIATAARIESCHALAERHDRWHVEGMADEAARAAEAEAKGTPAPLAVESEAAVKCRPPGSMEHCDTPEGISTNLHRMNQSVTMARELALCLTKADGASVAACVEDANTNDAYRVNDDNGANPAC